MISGEHLIWPDEACALLGMHPKQGEPACSKYNRRRHLKALGLKRYPGPWQGFKYDRREVLQKANQQLNAA